MGLEELVDLCFCEGGVFCDGCFEGFVLVLSGGGVGVGEAGGVLEFLGDEAFLDLGEFLVLVFEVVGDGFEDVVVVADAVGVFVVAVADHAAFAAVGVLFEGAFVGGEPEFVVVVGVLVGVWVGRGVGHAWCAPLCFEWCGFYVFIRLLYVLCFWY